MNLRSANAFWLLKHGIIRSYPSLQQPVKADIAIIGAGISGALVAARLCEAGFSTVIIDRRHAATGSTAASTALLQYEIDTPLYELVKISGKKNAFRSYQLCLNSITELEKICKAIKDPGSFIRKPSFQYASVKNDRVGLHEEFQLRKEAGIPVRWLEENEIKTKFGFRKEAGLLSKDGAEADAYRITHSLLARYRSKGLMVYDNTEITHILHHKTGVELTTSTRQKITAKKLVIACGYESQQYIPKKVQDLHATYAIASEPFTQKDLWYQNALIWETARPYLYLRTTVDNRIIIGGKDIPFTGPRKRDQLLTRKARLLEKAFSKLFPGIAFRTDFKWVGNFASTKDGLPYIGSIPQRPHTYFALGFGGNGICFSMIAANIISELLTKQKSPDAVLFSFDR